VPRSADGLFYFQAYFGLYNRNDRAIRDYRKGGKLETGMMLIFQQMPSCQHSKRCGHARQDRSGRHQDQCHRVQIPIIHPDLLRRVPRRGKNKAHTAEPVSSEVSAETESRAPTVWAIFAAQFKLSNPPLVQA
jgi:hypothetical protein